MGLFDGKVVVCGDVAGDDPGGAAFVEAGRLVQASHGVAFDLRYSEDADLNDALLEARLAVSDGPMPWPSPAKVQKLSSTIWAVPATAVVTTRPWPTRWWPKSRPWAVRPSPTTITWP